MAKLLVLDINGILCRKIDLDSVLNPDIKLRYYNVVLRPGVRDFLAYCYENFDVGYYSSTTYKNAGPILDTLLSTEQAEITKFKWFRDRTSLDPDWSPSSEKCELRAHQSWPLDQFLSSDGKKDLESFSTVKYLSSLLDSPPINQDRKYSLQNTLIVDDDALKMRFNPYKNVVLLSSFVPMDTENKDKDDLLRSLGPELSRRFDLLRVLT